MESTTFNVKNETGIDDKVSIDQYKKLRSKIKTRLEQFYSNVMFEDAGMDSSNIKYICTLYGRPIIKFFNVVEWLEAEQIGKFNEKYTEFTKSKKKSSLSIGDIANKTSNHFRTKRSF